MTASRPPNYENTSITSYVADFDLADNGDLDVTETITVDFPVYGKHGIFRFWDRVDPNDETRGATPRTSRSPGTASDEPFALSNEDHGRFRVAKIGSADVTLDTGEHVYVISYHDRRRHHRGRRRDHRAPASSTGT